MINKRKIIGVCGARLFEQTSIRFMSDLQKIGRERGYIQVAFSAITDSLVDTDDVLGELQFIDGYRHLDLSLHSCGNS